MLFLGLIEFSQSRQYFQQISEINKQSSNYWRFKLKDICSNEIELLVVYHRSFSNFNQAFWGSTYCPFSHYISLCGVHSVWSILPMKTQYIQYFLPLHPTCLQSVYRLSRMKNTRSRHWSVYTCKVLRLFCVLCACDRSLMNESIHISLILFETLFIYSKSLSTLYSHFHWFSFRQFLFMRRTFCLDFMYF